MEVNILIGAHRTGMHHMYSILMKNKDLLTAQGIDFADPKKVVGQLRKGQKELMDGVNLRDVQENLLTSLTTNPDAKRLVIICPDILGSVSRPFGKELFYPRTTGLVKQLNTLFQGVPLQLFVSVRNPATYIPSCYTECLLNVSIRDFKNEFITEVNLNALRWSALLHRIQGREEQNSVTVWRYEDYPYIWRDTIQAITGIANNQELEGVSHQAKQGLTLRGARLMYKYIEENPPKDKNDFQEIKKAFFDRFSSKHDLVTGPDWPKELVQMLTENYNDDWYYIESMDGIETKQPREYS